MAEDAVDERDDRDEEQEPPLRQPRLPPCRVVRADADDRALLQRLERDVRQRCGSARRVDEGERAIVAVAKVPRALGREERRRGGLGGGETEGDARGLVERDEQIGPDGDAEAEEATWSAGDEA